MHPVARVRHVLARRPYLYWAFVFALAGAAALAAVSAVAGIDDARRAWGSTRQVVVATADVAPGESLDGRTTSMPRPQPMVPDHALGSLPPSAVARQHVAAGEMVVEADVAARDGPVALIPDGWSGVPVSEAVPAGAAIGDHVAAASGGVVLAADALVVGTNDQTVTVAVPAPDAAAVAHASSTGELVLLLLP